MRTLCIVALALAVVMIGDFPIPDSGIVYAGTYTVDPIQDAKDRLERELKAFEEQIKKLAEQPLTGFTDAIEKLKKIEQQQTINDLIKKSSLPGYPGQSLFNTFMDFLEVTIYPPLSLYNPYASNSPSGE